MRNYDLGNPELDGLVKELVERSADHDNEDLIREMIVTVLKLHRDDPGRGDLKLVNTALKEMRYSMLVFSRHDEPKVTIFGSARLPESDPNYRLAEAFARIMVERKWGVVTGAGPGIMEAGNRGAGLDASYGVKIRLPFEADANKYVSPDKTVNFKYFFTRKLGFVKESHGFALFPGGFGTLDETFELLTLIQTGKSDMHPIVLLESEGTGYWGPLTSFLNDVLAEMGLIAPEDGSLFTLTHDPLEAADMMCGFYANFHSQRYVDGKLVLRLDTAPDAATLRRLTEEYQDILVDGEITAIEPTPAELRDGDALDCERVALHFDRRRFARLRQLIVELNAIVSMPDTVHPPAPYGDEQADRSF
jgi:uncharacterized protein (TIGR00730 family)